MVEEKRHIIPGIFLVIAAIVFFSFFMGEKDKGSLRSSLPITLISNPDSQGIQAINSPSVDAPRSDVSKASRIRGYFTDPGCNLARESMFSNRISGYFNSRLLIFPSINQVTGLTLLQKIPGQEKEDPLPPVC
jgi:hypothetical protein